MSIKRETPASQLPQRLISRVSFIRILLIANGVIIGLAMLLLLSWITGSSRSMADITYGLLLLPVYIAAIVIFLLNIIYIPWYLIKHRSSFLVVILGVIFLAASAGVIGSYVFPYVKAFVWDIPSVSRRTEQDRQARTAREYRAISTDEAKRLLLDCRLEEFAYYYDEFEHTWSGKKGDSGIELRTMDDRLFIAIDKRLNGELVPEARRARETRKTNEGCHELVVTKNGFDEIFTLKNGRNVMDEHLPYK